LQSLRLWNRIFKRSGRVWRGDQKETDAKEDAYSRRRDCAERDEVEQEYKVVLSHSAHRRIPGSSIVILQARTLYAVFANVNVAPWLLSAKLFC
jgi:hypothetical protein